MAVSNRFKKSVEKATDNTKETIQQEINSDDNKEFALDDILKSNKKSRGRNYTLYFSADVGEALDKQARASGMSKSELVNTILRKVLLEQYP